jgi:signal transduction histidine kinase
VIERTSELQETIKSLEGFCYSIAHDLRAPLRATKGFTEILLSDYAQGFDAAGRDYARRILEATTRMDRLILDLLHYGRLTHAEITFEEIETSIFVQQVILMMKEEINERGGEFILAPDLPVICANRTVLEQVLVNLISNSLKFCDQNCAPRIEIFAEQDSETIRLNVRDNGIGIPEEHRERIFKVFERLHDNQFPGTGIGLAIVQKGMERMGGRVSVSSTPGKGSTFTLIFSKTECD